MIDTKVKIASKDPVALLGTDFVEFYVSNAKQAAMFYQTTMGFTPVAMRTLKTGEEESESYILRQGKINIVLTAPLIGGTDIGRHIDKHGDAVKTIALSVEDAYQTYETCIARGAKPLMEPYILEDDDGRVIISGIELYGDTVHIFVDRSGYDGLFLPGYEPWEDNLNIAPVGLKYIDHMVANVDWGQMNNWVKFYKEVMGFEQLISFDDEDISTEYTALMSKVMSNGDGKVKFPINEPAEGKRKSQIEEFLHYHGGAGVQHLAMATDDIISTVSEMKRRGIDFLQVPRSYYDELTDRVGSIDEEVDKLREVGILVDRDDEGYLLQVFTKPLQSRPTLFFEIIQRKGARSFGKGNFKALFEAIEREQRNRGTL